MQTNSSYKNVINGIGEAIFIHNPETGAIIDVNEPMLKMFGYTKDEVIGMWIDELSCVEDGFTPEEAWAKTKNALSGKIELFEWKAKRKDNSIFWAEVSIKLSKFDQSKVLIAVVRDISEKKRNEQIIHRFTDFQFLLSELSTQFISLPNKQIDDEIITTLRIIAMRLKVDRASIFLYSNDEVSMSNSHEWCDKNIVSFKNNMHELNLKEFKWHHQTLISEGVLKITNIDEVSSEKAPLILAFKQQGIKSVLVAPFYNNGKIIGFIGIDSVNEYRNWLLEDIEELRSVGNIIGQALVRRNYEDMLQKAKEKAEESDRLKSAFLSNMSHEIRTPMNGILGFAELLEDKTIPADERHSFIKIIQDSGKQLLSIINDIIDISKIEAGQVNIILEKVNIIEIVEELVSLFNPLAHEKGISILFSNNIPIAKIHMITDMVKLKQIFTNLLSNAIKFTPSGSVTFSASINNNCYVFDVTDTGVGIDKSTQKAIFERFIRVDDDFSAKISGTGLGLSITKAYVEKMGGNISLKSQKGKGSVFSVIFPY